MKPLLMFVATHPEFVLTVLVYVAQCAVVALLPRSAFRFGLVRWLDRLSALTHSSAPGTLKWPLIAHSAVRFALEEMRAHDESGDAS